MRYTKEQLLQKSKEELVEMVLQAMNRKKTEIIKPFAWQDSKGTMLVRIYDKTFLFMYVNDNTMVKIGAYLYQDDQWKYRYSHKEIDYYPTSSNASDIAKEKDAQMFCEAMQKFLEKA